MAGSPFTTALLSAWTLSTVALSYPNGPWYQTPLGPDVLRDPTRYPGAIEKTVDYVVVGGGASGLTVASRLSEDPSVTVAIVEAGSFYQDVSNASVVPGYAADYLTGHIPPELDWGFDTEPQAGADGRVKHYTNAKTLGGNSAFNLMAYMTTSVGAMQKWAEEVDDDSWTYANVTRYFQKSLNFTGIDPHKRRANSTPELNPADVGYGGPLDVTYPNYAQPFSSWVKKAFDQVGMRPVGGFMSGELFGSSWVLDTINHTDGQRASSAKAFLEPILHRRENLFLYNRTLAERVLFDQDRTATGVQASRGKTVFNLTATKEVVLTAGGLMTPQLLQVSGVGNAALLKELRIPVVLDAPKVGQQMEDHISFGVAHRVDVETNSALKYAGPRQHAVEEFNEAQAGILSSPGPDFGGFADIPSELRNFSASTHADLAGLPKDWPEGFFISFPVDVGFPQDGYNYAMIVCTLMTPMSRGHIRIRSPSMHDSPVIDPRWLTSTTDVEIAVAAVRRIRQYLQMPVLERNVLVGGEVAPGPDVQTFAEIHDYLKKNFNSMSHPACTCRMGKEGDPDAVVDPKGRVFGVKNLRIADASVFRFLPPGLPLGVVYMVAEKIADDIKHDQKHGALEEGLRTEF
ncbi:GMC family oxidoreductase [Aspergillus fijiensis CBS 313.89]|uniref:Putative choline dehydrogenase n=1 Tax=Aspergillus fijiensis CBS 313.89 TaxID=1448319 RepID=A0A8G1VVG8_9EURO|nr:putative choline dehydrogenase [Aspergillus fijiensis CBS 313.89]RAK74475.1 putative choline dehydrogenase [Aspergillus fijiensis CBS 313.89]